MDKLKSTTEEHKRLEEQLKNLEEAKRKEAEIIRRQKERIEQEQRPKPPVIRHKEPSWIRNTNKAVYIVPGIVIVVLALILGYFGYKKISTSYNFMQGLKAFNAEQYDNAIPHFDKCVKLSPGDTKPLSYLAQAHFEKAEIFKKQNNTAAYNKEIQFSIDMLDKVIQINPNDAEALYARAQAYEFKGECERSLSDYKKVVALDPSYSGAKMKIESMGNCVGKCPPGMAYIPPGSFTMGCSTGDNECDDDEKPAKSVTITKGFCMDATEVAQGAYERVMGVNPSGYDECGANCPVEQADWNSAKAYCGKAGKRLPTEAEWEYAARGGTTTKYYWGNSMDGAYAWYEDNSNNQTHPVGKKKANGFGLYDMAGNVWEWVEDCYDSGWYSKMPVSNPLNTSTGCGHRVLRGGSRSYSASELRSSSRSGYILNWYNDFGFRCAQDF